MVQFSLSSPFSYFLLFIFDALATVPKGQIPVHLEFFEQWFFYLAYPPSLKSPNPGLKSKACT
jgi:hypothetical protein